MARIPIIEYENACEPARARFDDQVAHNGRMTNMKKTLLNSLPAFDAMMQWYPLRDEARKFLTEREINIFCHAISTQNDCVICSLFFRKIMVDSGGSGYSELSKREKALLDFGKQCAANPHAVSDEMFAALKEHFNDEQIVLLTAFAALMIATNLINTVLKVDLDTYLEPYANL
jgi:hypothetical protein